MIYRMNRRDFVVGGLGGLLTAPVLVQKRRQRVIVFLADGLGAEYISASDMPVLKSWGRKGIVKTVDGVMPSVTNANNASVCCGLWPEERGCTASGTYALSEGHRGTESARAYFFCGVATHFWDRLWPGCSQSRSGSKISGKTIRHQQGA